jgi:hypothetical protein
MSRDDGDPIQQGAKIVGRHHFGTIILVLTEQITSAFQFVEICFDVRFNRFVCSLRSILLVWSLHDTPPYAHKHTQQKAPLAGARH